MTDNSLTTRQLIKCILYILRENAGGYTEVQNFKKRSSLINLINSLDETYKANF